MSASIRRTTSTSIGSVIEASVISIVSRTMAIVFSLMTSVASRLITCTIIIVPMTTASISVCSIVVWRSTRGSGISAAIVISRISISVVCSTATWFDWTSHITTRLRRSFIWRWSLLVLGGDVVVVVVATAAHCRWHSGGNVRSRRSWRSLSRVYVVVSVLPVTINVSIVLIRCILDIATISVSITTISYWAVVRGTTATAIVTRWISVISSSAPWARSTVARWGRARPFASKWWWCQRSRRLFQLDGCVSARVLSTVAIFVCRCDSRIDCWWGCLWAKLVLLQSIEGRDYF